MFKTLGVVVVVAAAAAATVAAQETVATDPLRCWWRTSAGAVRVGEPFFVVLTCSVLETAAVTIVPDQSPLEPSVVQFAPFENLGGTHQPDLRSDDRRFFQYEYRLRIISEDAFGKDVKFPDTKVSYRVQSQVGAAAIEGRDRVYVLPPMSVRVVSLVPADATDIRDAAAATFSSVESRRFRASVLSVTATVLFTLAGLTAIVALVRSLARGTRDTAVRRPVPDAAVLRGLRREVAAIGRERQGDGWTPALASRLATALRIAAGYAIGSPPSQVVSADGVVATEGQLLVRSGLVGRRRVLIAGSTTPLAMAERAATGNGASGARQAHLLDELTRSLGAVTAAQYGRATTLDEASLDEALGLGAGIVRRLAIANLWALRRARQLRQRLWFR